MREEMQELALNFFHELSKKMTSNNTWHANQIHAFFLLAEIDDILAINTLPFSLTWQVSWKCWSFGEIGNLSLVDTMIIRGRSKQRKPLS